MAIPFIDLCSGIGGFHSGLVNTGHYRCVGHAEIDKNAEKAYNAIYGEEGGLNYGDLRTINPRELPHFDLLCGGFPCQSFSVAGRRLGFRDTRGTVFFEIARILAEKRPPFLLLENVLGLLWHIPTYKTKEWHGGTVWYEEAHPSVLFAKDGEIYDLEGLRHIVIGGAYSVDKFYRLSRGYGWWSDEQPSEEIKQYVEQQLKENAIDVVLSHTCPFKYEPVEEFLPGIDQSTVYDSTEKWLDVIEETTDYMAWFCGHWHTNKRIDKMHFLFHQFESSEELQKMKVNKTNLEREMEDG